MERYEGEVERYAERVRIMEEERLRGEERYNQMLDRYRKMQSQIMECEC
jgi:predicted nuclease with TOPRIM domain